MKKSFLLPLCTLFLLWGCDDEETNIKPHIDLAVESFDFTIEKTAQFEGNITFTAIIKNVGADYRSNDGQQSISLIQIPPAGQSVTLESEKFKDLDAGETIELRYTHQGWRASQEFPPSFRVRIGFDPDLYIDGNPHNDDSNTENNMKEITGQQINARF